MKPRTLLALAVCAAGYAATGVLFPRALRQPAEPVRVDAETARARAAGAVRALWGVDISQWRMTVDPAYRFSVRVWQEKYARGGFDTAVSPAEIKLKFADPEKQRDFTVVLSRGARVMEVDRNQSGRAFFQAGLSQAGLKKDLSPEDRLALARKALDVVTGEFASQFLLVETAGQSGQYHWRAPSADRSLEWDVQVKLDGGELGSAKVSPKIDNDERKRLLAPVGSLGDTAGLVSGVMNGIGAGIFGGLFVIGWIRKTVDRPAVRTAAALVFTAGILPRLFAWEPTAARIFGFAAISLLYAMAIGAGQAAARETEWVSWRDMRLLLARQWRGRGIYRGVMWGILFGGLVAAIPLFIQVSGLFPGSLLDRVSWLQKALTSHPQLWALDGIFEIGSVALYVGLLPWLTQQLGVRWVALLVFLPLATGFHFYNSPFIAGFAAAIANGLFMTLVTLAIYLRLGLLATLAAGKTSVVIWTTMMMLTSESPRLHQSAWWLAGSLAVLTGVMAFMIRMTVEIEPVDLMATRFLSQRERLKAEFSLAQQAQQRLLPADAPDLPGFTIATACVPARDVGGDLFDYFRLADGRYGFCVADVSGKGMPAALYMTLTKGLLAAASPEASSLSDLARRVNRHLYVACRRRMFVTAAMAVVDPASRTVEYLRAGHNPALLYEAVSGKARYLNTPGVGLGLAGPALFDRGAHTQQLTVSVGDVLVFYSDGVTEAMNQRLELYGEERLQATLERVGNRPAGELLEAVRADLAAFTGSEPAHDDITLLILQTV